MTDLLANCDLAEQYQGQRCLITGGLGFIGSNLAHSLVDLGAEVLIVDSMIGDYGGNLFNIHGIRHRVGVNIADVREQAAMGYLLRGQDYVFNLAGQVAHLDSMTDPYTDLEINCRAQLSLLEACRANNPTVKIVYSATRQQYGRPDYLPLDERHVQRPTDVNGINKMAGERYHLLYNDVYGLRATSLRLTNTYGPRQLMKHGRQGFIAVWVRKAVLGERIEIWGDGQQLRDLTHVDDVVRALLLAGASEAANGQVFNLSGPVISLLNLARLVIDVAGGGEYVLCPFPDERQRIDVGSCYCDASKAQQMLGWEPSISLSEGLQRTIDFYRRYGEHYWHEHVLPVDRQQPGEARAA